MTVEIGWQWYQWAMAFWIIANVIRSAVRDGQWSYTPPLVGMLIIVGQFWLLGQGHFWSTFHWPQSIELILMILAFISYLFLPKNKLVTKSDITTSLIGMGLSIGILWAGGFWGAR
jgi:hypothetical protein